MNDKEIDIYEIISILYRKKISILAISFLFVVISVFFAFSLPNKYSSFALLAPSGDQNTNKMLGQMGGLASLAGISLDENSSKTEEAIERIQSYEFFEKFIFSEGMLVNLMASKSWDPNSKQVITMLIKENGSENLLFLLLQSPKNLHFKRHIRAILKCYISHKTQKLVLQNYQ